MPSADLQRRNVCLRQREPHRAIRVGPLEIYQEAKHAALTTPWFSLSAVATDAWRRRGWWGIWLVGDCLLVRAYIFVLTVRLWRWR